MRWQRICTGLFLMLGGCWTGGTQELVSATGTPAGTKLFDQDFRVYVPSEIQQRISESPLRERHLAGAELAEVLPWATPTPGLDIHYSDGVDPTSGRSYLLSLRVSTSEATPAVLIPTEQFAASYWSTRSHNMKAELVTFRHRKDGRPGLRQASHRAEDDPAYQVGVAAVGWYKPLRQVGIHGVTLHFRLNDGAVSTRSGSLTVLPELGPVAPNRNHDWSRINP